MTCCTSGFQNWGICPQKLGNFKVTCCTSGFQNWGICPQKLGKLYSVIKQKDQASKYSKVCKNQLNFRVFGNRMFYFEKFVNHCTVLYDTKLGSILTENIFRKLTPLILEWYYCHLYKTPFLYNTIYIGNWRVGQKI